MLRSTPYQVTTDYVNCKRMSHINSDSIHQILKTIIDPETGIDVVTSGMVSSLVIRGGNIGFALEINSSEAGLKEPLRKACEDAVASLPGVERVMVALTGDSSGKTLEHATTKAPAAPKKQPIEGVKHIIAVASGKGGVGKSTCAVNLAVALAKAGLKVGLADADIYGPSVPRMLGLKQKPDIQDNKMVPIERYGIKSVSMGYLLPDDVATVWRGPMATKALYQLLRGTHWGSLDLLVIDMPPGTGDIQLSLAENYPVSGAVMVSTPQEVALLDVRKAITMFRKVHIPIWGIIENMSGEIFGKGGAEKLAKDEKIDFLGALPLDAAIRQASDDGKPTTRYYEDIAPLIIKKLD